MTELPVVALQPRVLPDLAVQVCLGRLLVLLAGLCLVEEHLLELQLEVL